MKNKDLSKTKEYKKAKKEIKRCYNQILEYAKLYNLQDDLLVIGLNSNIFYNPLHKPNLKPLVLANRLKTILTEKMNDGSEK